MRAKEKRVCECGVVEYTRSPLWKRCVGCSRKTALYRKREARGEVRDWRVCDREDRFLELDRELGHSAWVGPLGGMVGA